MLANERDVGYLIANKKTVRSVWENNKLQYFYSGPNKTTTPWTLPSENEDIKYFKHERIWAPPSTTSWAPVEGELPNNTFGFVIRFHNYVVGPSFSVYKDPDKKNKVLSLNLFGSYIIKLTTDMSTDNLTLSTPVDQRDNTYGVILYIYRTGPKSSDRLYVDVVEYMNGVSNILKTSHYVFINDSPDLLRPDVKGYYSTTITASGINGITTVITNAIYYPGTQKIVTIQGTAGTIKDTDGFYVFAGSLTPEGGSVNNLEATMVLPFGGKINAVYNNTTNSISYKLYTTTSGGSVRGIISYYSI